MCLKENYSDSPSNEYLRHYSAESESQSEYLRRQNMNSKLGEDKKKGHHVRKSPNFDSNSVKKQKKKGQNDNGLILGRVLRLDSAHPYIKSIFNILAQCYAEVCRERRGSSPRLSARAQYYAEACNERRGPSSRLSARATSLRRNTLLCRDVSDIVSDLMSSRIEPVICRVDSDVLNHYTSRPVGIQRFC